MEVGTFDPCWLCVRRTSLSAMCVCVDGTKQVRREVDELPGAVVDRP